MKNVLTIIISSLLIANLHAVYAQKLTGHDASDVYRQHQLIKLGDKFLFTDKNMITLSAFAQFDSTDRLRDQPSFKLRYPDSEREKYLFWLRHPLVIKPYTAYKLTFQYQATDTEGNGPFLEFGVYDATRETQVESHKFIIEENQHEWTARNLEFTTSRGAAYARLWIKGSPGGSACVLLRDVQLTQVSDPNRFETPASEIVAGLATSDVLTTDFFQLPAANHYQLSIANDPAAFTGHGGITITWFADKGAASPLAADVFKLTRIHGVQAQWDGIQIEWKRAGNDGLDSVSRQLEKLFKGKSQLTSKPVIFNIPKPNGARFAKINANTLTTRKRDADRPSVVFSAAGNP